MTSSWPLASWLNEPFENRALTVCLAGVVDPGEVLAAAAFVGALGVVADVGANSKLLTLILI